MFYSVRDHDLVHLTFHDRFAGKLLWISVFPIIISIIFVEAHESKTYTFEFDFVFLRINLVYFLSLNRRHRDERSERDRE